MISNQVSYFASKNKPTVPTAAGLTLTWLLCRRLLKREGPWNPFEYLLCSRGLSQLDKSRMLESKRVLGFSFPRSSPVSQPGAQLFLNGPALHGTTGSRVPLMRRMGVSEPGPLGDNLGYLYAFQASIRNEF